MVQDFFHQQYQERLDKAECRTGWAGRFFNNRATQNINSDSFFSGWTL